MVQNDCRSQRSHAGLLEREVVDEPSPNATQDNQDGPNPERSITIPNGQPEEWIGVKQRRPCGVMFVVPSSKAFRQTDFRPGGLLLPAAGQPPARGGQKNP